MCKRNYFIAGKCVSYLQIHLSWASRALKDENGDVNQAWTLRAAAAWRCRQLLLTVLAQCPGTAGSLLGAAFLAVKADRALCHSRGAVLPNCLFSTTLSSISLLTAPLQSENANKDQFSCQISGNHIAPGTTQCESL